jgi:hypothetical protein
MTDNKRAADDAKRYREWKHLREHGRWSNGVPKWARNYAGRMDDMTAAVAVIEELASLSSRADGGKDSSDARDAERYRRIRLGLSDVHGDVYAMVFAGDGDYPEDGDDLDRIVDAAIAREKKCKIESKA